MCGIAGQLFFSSSSRRCNAEILTKMATSMAHRGPDGEGIWLSKSNHTGLAHRRLSIIDLSDQAAQPMVAECGRYTIVYNGEVYNHAMLRAELEGLGHRFTTNHSDTETVLRAFIEWGVDSVHRLHGMFAFAVWDDREKCLWLVRDRIGIKPLYYTIKADGVSFGSEIKAILTDPHQKREINEEALFHYLTFMTVPAPDTLFDGINKLPAGSWIRVSQEGEVKQSRYWDVFDHTRLQSHVSLDEAAEQVMASLKQAVSYRKQADVDVGVFLSGGIDSSTNVALFQEGETRPVKTFSIGYDNDYGTYKNELHYASSVANHFKTEHYERRLTQDDLLDFLPKMVNLQDEPIADPVCVPVYFVSELAVKQGGVKVAQVGEGADELFCGYPSWQRMLKLQALADLPGARMGARAGLPLLQMIGRDKGFRYEYMRRASLDQPVFWTGADCFPDLAKRALLSPRLRDKFADLSSYEVLRPIRQRFENKAPEKSALNWMSYVDLSIRLPELLLMRVDKMSMGTSLECRVPFLDHEFVALAMSLPSDLKTKDGELKAILKRAVRGTIPDQIINRPKQGFGVPVYEWFFDRLGKIARDEVLTFARETDLLDPLEVTRLFDAGDGFSAWWLLNLALWHKHYIKAHHVS